MAKVYVKFNTAVIKEIELTKDETTFGRKSGNDIVVENPAISGFHGKFVKEGADFYVEDLNSTNGTFINGERIKRTLLKNKDEISIARHVLEFVLDAGAPTTGEKLKAISAPAEAPYAPPPIIIEDKPKSQPLATEEKPAPVVEKKESETPVVREVLEEIAIDLEKLPPQPPASKPSTRPVEGDEAPSSPSAASDTTGKIGVVKVISGGPQMEFPLKDLVTYIGTADQAAIKLKGFMAPSLAAAISKRPEGYVLKAVKPGYPKVNGVSIKEQIFLENGAMLEFGALTAIFQLVAEKNKAADSPDAGGE